MIAWALIAITASIAAGALWADFLLWRRCRAILSSTRTARPPSTRDSAVVAVEEQLPGYGIVPVVGSSGVTITVRDVRRLLAIMAEAQYARDALHMLALDLAEVHLQRKETVTELRELCRRHRIVASDHVNNLVDVLDVWIRDQESADELEVDRD
ncbi:MAG: hypothetical protein ABFR47_07625 [Verrucomicrobiota bacterium]